MKSNREKKRAVLIERTALLLAASSVISSAALVSCGRRGGGEGSGTSDESITESVSETAREPLSTVIIDINAGNNGDEGETTAPPDDTGTASGPVVSLPQTLDMGTKYTDKFTFVCDSTIYGLKSLGMLTDGRSTKNVVTGQGGSLFLGSDEPLVFAPDLGGVMSVEAFCSKKLPEYLLLSLGAEDLKKSGTPMPLEDFSASYLALLQKIKSASPNTVVICLSLLPGSNNSGLSLSDVEPYNARILSAAEAAGVYYLDAASSFSASDGYLRVDCDAGDSRLSAAGLARLLELIRTHYIGNDEQQ